MTWARIDDSYPHHPKMMGAGLDALGFDVAGICYSNRFGTDGFISDEVLPAVYPPARSPKKIVAKLEAAGRWHRVEGGWQIHGYSDYNFTAEEQEERRKKKAEAGRKGGQASGRSRQQAGGSSTDEADASGSVEAEANPEPDPTRSQPEPPHFGDGSTPGNPNRAREAGDLVARMVSVCENPDTQAAFKVVNHLTDFLDPGLIDECIGYCAGLSRDRRPRHPNYFEATLRAWAKQKNIEIPAMNGATA